LAVLQKLNHIISVQFSYVGALMLRPSQHLCGDRQR